MSPRLNLRTQLIRNVLSSWVFQFAYFVVFFFLSPYINNTFGTERAGTWFLLGSITGYAGIMAFGIPGATEKYVAQYLATGDRDQVNRVVSTSLYLSLWIAVITAPLAAALYVFGDEIFRFNAQYVAEAKWVLLIVGVDLVLAYPCSLMFSVLSGFNRHEVQNAIQIPALLIKTVGFVLAIRYGGGITAMALVQAGVNLLSYGVVTLWVLHHAPWLRVRLGLAERSMYRVLLVYGVFQFFAMAADRIVLNTDKIILGTLVSMSMVSAYNIAAQLRAIGRLISSGLGMPLRTASSHLDALEDSRGLQVVATIGARVLLASVGGLYVLYAAWGDQFVRLWQPRVFEETGAVTYYCLLILITPAFLTVVLIPGISVLYGLGRHQPHGVLGIIVAVANVGLSVWLALYWGVYGVAIGTVVPLFFARGLYMYVYIPRVLRMGLWDYVGKCWGRPLLGLVPLGAVLWGLRCVLSFDRLLWLMLFFFAVGAVYAAWVYLVVLTGEEKRLVHDIAAGRPFIAERQDGSS